MDKTPLEQAMDYIANIEGSIEKGMAAVIIRAVDRFAFEFFERVRQNTKWNRLQGIIKLVPYKSRKRKYQYGYYLLFDGYDIQGEKKVPLQLIANVLNTGRIRTEGKIGGRAFVSPSLEGTKFISSSLDILSGIDKEIAKKSDIANWVISDDYLITNDGDKIDINDLRKYIKMMEEGE